MLLLQDFALARGVNDAIADLVASGRAGAVSSYAVSDLWPDSARELRAVVQDRQHYARDTVSTGLKLALTGAFTPLTAGFGPADDGSLPTLLQLAQASERMGLHHDILEAELRAQVRRYIAHMDEAPSFIELDPIIPLFGEAMRALGTVLAHFGLEEIIIVMPYDLSEALPAAPVPLSGLMAQIRFASLRKHIWRGNKSGKISNPRRQLRYPSGPADLPPRQSLGLDGQFWTACSPARSDDRLERFDLDPLRRQAQFDWLEKLAL